ncbi:hypothetical protein [Burkholderia sp. Ac-20365]|uniref:hypothetical protein n=1 Tax=Burkholderia sp. Ac-20365 TaxID=2703897 RepID=UPI00197BB19E|nr:hypothetical protein [Burkholderia sp. Ac-20365]MBN3761077.1 hypothetical protein [Burkholderia sp. Ac-20365]
MNKQKENTTKLWPILEPQSDLPISPAAWTLLNAVAVIAIASPFLLIVAAFAGGMFLSDTLQTTLEGHFAHGSTLPAVVANTLRVFMLIACFRIAAIVATTVPYLVRQAREGLTAALES